MARSIASAVLLIALGLGVRPSLAYGLRAGLEQKTERDLTAQLTDATPTKVVVEEVPYVEEARRFLLAYRLVNEPVQTIWVAHSSQQWLRARWIQGLPTHVAPLADAAKAAGVRDAEVVIGALRQFGAQMTPPVNLDVEIAGLVSQHLQSS